MTQLPPKPWLRDGRLIYSLNDDGTNHVWAHFHSGAHGASDLELEEYAECAQRALRSHDALVAACRGALMRLCSEGHDGPETQACRAALTLGEKGGDR